MKKANGKAGDLQIWWNPQVGLMEFFHVDVKTPEEGRRLLEVLADYDAFQFEHKIRSDYVNTGGLSVLEDDGEGGLEWVEWENEDGLSVDEVDE